MVQESCACAPLVSARTEAFGSYPMEPPGEWHDADLYAEATEDAFVHTRRIQAANRGPALEHAWSSEASAAALSLTSGVSDAGPRCVDAVGHPVATTDDLYNDPIQNLLDCGDRVNTSTLGTTFSVCPMCFGTRCQECMEHGIRRRAEPATHARAGRIPVKLLCSRCSDTFSSSCARLKGVAGRLWRRRTGSG